jgi:hypothetical protein
MPLLMVLVLGVLDFGRAFHDLLDSTHLANVAARYATVNKNPGAPGGQTLQQWILENQTSSEGLKMKMRVCISFPNGTQNAGDPVKIEITSTHRWLGFLTSEIDSLPATTTLEGQATMRLEANATNFNPGCHQRPVLPT